VGAVASGIWSRLLRLAQRDTLRLISDSLELAAALAARVGLVVARLLSGVERGPVFGCAELVQGEVARGAGVASGGASDRRGDVLGPEDFGEHDLEEASWEAHCCGALDQSGGVGDEAARAVVSDPAPRAGSLLTRAEPTMLLRVATT
jgi:hypothetical protein